MHGLYPREEAGGGGRRNLPKLCRVNGEETFRESTAVGTSRDRVWL